MATSNINIPYDYHIDVASNEFFLRATINRNLEKLLKNDVYLAKKIEEYGTGNEFSIQCYKSSRIYNKGDAVVYIEFNEDKSKILNLYLLESIVNNNTNEPSYEIVDTFIRDFRKSGWDDANSLFSIYNSTDENANISSLIETIVSNKFHLSHEIDLSCHKFGELSSVEELSSKLLLNDVSNIADDHVAPFFAYQTFPVKSSNYHGTCKKWGNGLIEYDIVFTLDGSSKTMKTISENGAVENMFYYKVNSFVPLSNDVFNNDDYFLSAIDYNIFNINGSNDIYEVNGTQQTNVSKQVNTYHGTIEFPMQFADLNYMIFTSSTANENGASQSPNTLVFADRQLSSITVLYVIPNYSNLEKIEETLLKNNEFQCQIIGRWKRD